MVLGKCTSFYLSMKTSKQYLIFSCAITYEHTKSAKDINHTPSAIHLLNSITPLVITNFVLWHIKHWNKKKRTKEHQQFNLKSYSFAIISRIRGILKSISLEAAISGTRQNEARSVTASCKYASWFSPPFPVALPFPIPKLKDHN